MLKPFLIICASVVLAQPIGAAAQEALDHAAMDHGAMDHALPAQSGPREAGQSAFAAIQEIVALLRADPATDWGKVDIESLRQHLIDMDNVTLRADVTATELPTGARFAVTSPDPAVQGSIHRMVLAHAATMQGVEGWRFEATQTATGADLAVLATAAEAAQIRGLGFIGVMTVGVHHQGHHLALASGVADPHSHEP